MADSSLARHARTYGNWQRPTSAGLLGLGSVGTALLLGGLVSVVIAVMFAGVLAAVCVAAAIGVLLLLLVVRDEHGRNAIARIGARSGWMLAGMRGETQYRSGPVGRIPPATYQLPGIVAPTRLSEHVDSLGRSFALLLTPASGTYTVVLGTEPDGAALVDQEQIDSWVSEWGHWLSTLGDEQGIEAASVTIETAPDTGTRLRREVQDNLHPHAPAFARAVLDEAVADYPTGSSTVKAFVALTFQGAARVGARRRAPDEMARELSARIPGLAASLQATGAGAVQPLSAQELCEVVRIAYDPAVASLIDESHAAGETPRLAWGDVGPAAARASWGGYRHDSAYSTTWAMTVAPRGSVHSNVLARLLAPHRDIARKRVTLLYRPIEAARAAALVEADLSAAQFKQTSTAKPAARDILAVRAAAATASEEASGAGLVNFGLLVTATVLDAEAQLDAGAAIDALAATARLRLRPVYGSQDSAFAAALPLGLVLSRHLKLPSELREKL